MSDGQTVGGKRGRGIRAQVPDAALPKHELAFIMKLGLLDREQALALVKKYQGDREKIFADLAARKK